MSVRTLHHVFILLLCCAYMICYSFADVQNECSFPNSAKYRVWFGKPSQVKSCFDTIPLNETLKTETLDIIDKVFSLYSFSDLVQSAFPPFFLQVDWPAQLLSIRNAAYSSDFDFHLALGYLMTSLKDAHAIYYAPRGYRMFASIRPFSLTSKLINGTQQFYAEPGNISPKLYKELCQCDLDLSDFYGRQIIAIEGENVMTYLLDFASNAGFYLDEGVQLNNLLSTSSQFPLQATAFLPLPEDTLTLAFEGDLISYTFDLFSTCSNNISSADQIIKANQNPFRSKSTRKDAHGELNGDSLYEDERDILNLLEAKMKDIKEKKLNEGQDKRDSDEINMFSESDIQLASKYIDALKSSMKQSESATEARQRNQKRENLAPAVRYQKIMEAWGMFLKLETKDASITKKTSNKSIKPESTLPQVEAKNHASITSFDVNTTLVNVVVGKIDNLAQYDNSEALSYWSYDEVTVLKLSSFYPPTEKSIDKFIKTFETAAYGRGSRGLGKDLIIDVSGNGGGYVCLSYFALSYLVRDWNSGSIKGNDILYNTYDFRQSEYTDELFQEGYFGPGREEIDPVTRQPLGRSFYTKPVERGNVFATSNYTKQFLWELCPESTFKPSKTSWVFNKILVITDGRCGSACSYFISKLRTSNKVRVMSYGGKWGSPMDTSSFAGGNVHSWTDWIDELKESGFKSDWVKHLPTSAVTSFNFREMFNPGDTIIPRQFVIMPADFALPFWDPLLHPDLSTKEGKQALATLYSSALPLFEKIPAGLPGKNPTSKTLTIVLAAMGIIIASVIVVSVLICIIRNHRNKIMEQYGQFDNNF